MKRIFLINGLIALLCFCAPNLFAYDFEVDGIRYNLIEGKADEVTVAPLNTIFGIYSGRIIIPETITVSGKKYKVTAIGGNAFRYQSITTIIIPNSVTSIGKSAFSNCGVLQYISLPNSIKVIPENCFERTSLIYLKIPESVEEIGYQAFYRCTRPIVEIPSSVKAIGSYAFDGTNGAIVISRRQDPVSVNFYALGTISVDVPILYVPHGTKSKYELCRGWDNASEIKEYSSTTYNLSISSSGNGCIWFNGTYICNETVSYTINEGLPTRLNIFNDDGYKVKSVRINGIDMTSEIQSTSLDNINSDTHVEVEFAPIQSDITHTLSIKSTGNGYASYNGTKVRNSTNNFTINDGSSATVIFIHDDGYRIKSVKRNGSNVTASVLSGRYTVSNIQSNTMIEVEFEEISTTTYDLTITATDGGYISYGGSSIRNTSRSFYVNAGTSHNVTITPDDGYRIKTLKKNGSTVLTNYSTSYQYTVSNISANTTVAVEFEAIPATTYSLTVKATGNGSASFASNTVRNGSKSISVNKGASVSISFTPDNGYHINYVRVNNVDRTSYVANYQYTVSNISANTTVEVDFVEDTKAFTYQNINYSVSSYPNKTIKLTKGNYGRVLEVPAKVTYQSTEWTVVGAEADALDGNESLAAVIWHPNASFTARASNPNLLLYVNDATYAQTTISNVVANGTAQSIILTDAASGNEFYCPQRFVAQNISYTHHYRMETGINEARGWETLVLPFDVEKVTHESKGSAVPFINWKSGDTARPFWLMQLDNSGWKEAESIKANRPYIISMPNNANYLDEFLLSGAVTFSATNATIDKTENLPSANYNGRTFIPNFAEIGMGDGAYALNVSNDIETNVSGAADGSRFVLNLRKVHPFEAYMTTSTRGTRSIDLSEGMGVIDNNNDEERISVYNIKGMMMKTNTGYSMEEIRRSLPAGVYIINKRKVLVK